MGGGGERPPVPGVAADHDAGRTGGDVAAQLSPQHSLTAAERFVDAGDLLLAADLLQVVRLLALVVAGAAAIGAGNHRTVLVVTGDIETGGAVVVNPQVSLLHVNTDYFSTECFITQSGVS